MTTARHIPANATAIRSTKSATVAYLYTNKQGRFIVIGYTGARSVKAAIYYAFSTPAKRMAYVAGWMRQCDEAQASKDAYKAKKREALAKPHTLALGDVLVSSWGYDQTNIDFYQVTRLVGKRSVAVRAIAAESVDTEHMQGKCVPAVGVFKGEEMTKRVDEYGALTISSCQRAYPAERIVSNGATLGYKPHHWTAYA